MRTGTLAFLLGVWLLQQQAELPGRDWAWLLVLAVPLGVWLKPFWHLPVWLAAGYLWSLLVASHLLGQALPADLEGRDLIIEGRIAGLPVRAERRLRFEFDVEEARTQGQPVTVPQRVRLNWYGQPPPLVPGEPWRLKVRLKRPHGFLNPGGFDYEAWLFRHRIRATGYVRKDALNRRLGPPRGEGLQRWRKGIRDRLAAVLPTPAGAMVRALVMGDRSAITPAQWEVMRRTGTTHLMAISGLHIGLVAGLAFFLGQRLWRFSGRGMLWLPAPGAGAVLALLAAVGYAGLAGFSVPTQRALIMVAVVMLALLLGRPVQPSRTLALALLLVLILDPLAVLAAGFWLSFGAVAIIFYGLAGRTGRIPRWRQALRVQWWISLGLFPLLVLFFQQASLVAPPANLVAVPLVGLLVVPLALTGTLLLGLVPPLGTALLALSSGILESVFRGLTWLGDAPLGQLHLAAISPGAVVLAGLGVVLLMLPRGLPGRWPGLILFLPLLLGEAPRPNSGQAWFTLLDVGQGLAAVVQTRHHTLVFDTGPRFGPNFDTGRAVVVPFLRQAGVRQVDTLIVSHGDRDHIGGVESLLAAMPARRILSSVPDKLRQYDVARCREGQRWDWDGVRFRILHPAGNGGRRRNDASCVLQVTAGPDVLLLTGDIEKPAERDLLRRMPDALRATVLVAPHHGSNTSSTAEFIRAVAPRQVLFPVGYRNRYRFPAARVTARYDAAGIQRFDTAKGGAIALQLGEGDRTVRLQRRTARRYWHDD